MHPTIGLYVPPSRRMSSTSRPFTGSIITTCPGLHEFSGPTGGHPYPKFGDRGHGFDSGRAGDARKILNHECNLLMFPLFRKFFLHNIAPCSIAQSLMNRPQDPILDF